MATPAHAAQAVAQQQTYRIAPGDLGKALDAMSAQGNVQVVYAPELVAGKTTHGLSGSFAAVEALRRLLDGTDLTWQAVNDSTFVVKGAAPVVVPAKPGEAHKADAKKSVHTLDTVTVSGSLINKAQIETATPTYTITAAAIDNRAFDDVEDVLQNSVFSVGSVQGESHSGSFTQGAQTYSLFGLAPGFTLLLVDGKPMTNFGELYNGSSSFNNVSNLPTSMIERIDVMPGGGSSIYGSSAIAGVVNVVTKQHMEGVQVSARTSNYSQGGGANQRLSFAFGHTMGKLDVLGSLEFNNRSPIWGYQRDLTRGVIADPDGVYTPSYVADIETFGHSGKKPGSVKGYYVPPSGCDAMAGLFGGSTVETANLTSTKRTGTYCGSDIVDGYRTYASAKRSYDALLKLKYYANDNLRLYGDVMANYESKRYGSSSPHWEAENFPNGYIEDAATHEILQPERYFAPEEIAGGYAGNAKMYTQNDLLAQIDVGANGRFGASGWDWDVYYLHSSDRTRYNKPLFLSEQIDGFFSENFLGPLVGVDPKTHLNMYHPDYEAFFTPLTPEQYAGLIYNVNDYAKTWVNNTRFTVSNGDWFAMPGGDAGVAGLIEGGNEAWFEPVDPLMAAGEVFGHTATAGGGRRSHQAAAFQLNLPVLQKLTVDLSGRYDRYSTGVGPDNHKFTYKAGLEYRPFDSLLIRSNYATAFQAPQMPAMFLGPSQSFSDVVDYYQCAVDLATTCDTYEEQTRVTHEGNTRLQPTTAQSWTTGMVWAPTGHLTFHVDYLHITIQNEVVLEDKDLLMQDEARCRLGELDAASVRCQRLTDPANGQVRRDIFGNISGVTAYYANMADETVKSINAGADYAFDTARLGRFSLGVEYNDMLAHTYREYPGTPLIDQLNNPEYSAGFKSVVSGQLSWRPNHRWHSTLYFHRYGSMPNYAAQKHGLDDEDAGRVAPWITWNWSVGYKPTRNLDLSLKVNNLFNKNPPDDLTYTSRPYYDTDLYNLKGRAVMLEARYSLGDAAR